jgi:hypothetical protein
MASGIPPPTIKRLEAAEGLLGGWETTVQKIGNSLKKAGVEFIAENVPDCASAKARGRNPLIPRFKAASGARRSRAYCEGHEGYASAPNRIVSARRQRPSIHLSCFRAQCRSNCY